MGLMLGTPFLGAAPDVGVFEFGQLYTPQPPANLVATFVATPFRHIELTWTRSIDDPERVWEYQIFRSTDPVFPARAGDAALRHRSGREHVFRRL